MRFTLKAKTAREARMECKARFPQGCTILGYTKGLVPAVYISSVREAGNHANVATVKMNRAPLPTRFVAVTKP